MWVVLKTLFEYRTAECRLDWIDLLAFTAFHLSLDGDITKLQRLKRRYCKLDMHFDINISQVSKTEEIILNRKNKKCKF